jgi:cytochrome b
MGTASEGRGAPAGAPVRVWDLPTRLFHWLLAALALFSFVTAKVGGAWIQWHFYSGYTIVSLVLFRLLWGFAGSRYACFATFLKGPREIVAFVRSGSTVAGHNPLGALSVLAILASLLVQGTTGLFATDDIVNEGPLAELVASPTAAILTRIHRWNEWLLLVLVGLHLAAVLYYLLVRRRNLIVPMLTGDQFLAGAIPARDDRSMRLRAALLAGVAAGLVAYVVNL